ncbi:MAG: hypothetical protein RBT49_02335 [Bacteroidales bacterium]|jgi:hypothetical protein|nr:hypothetical protein [Bacteroidales bacterium]
MLSFREYLIEKVLSDNEYENLLSKFKKVWDDFDSVRSKYRDGKIDRNEYMKQKQNFDNFQQHYNSLVA